MQYRSEGCSRRFCRYRGYIDASASYIRVIMTIVKRRVFLASRRVALARLRDLPNLTLRLPFSIVFFRERVAGLARVSH